MNKGPFLFKVALALALLALCSCASIQEEQEPPASPDAGQFILYLDGPDRTFQDLTFELKAVDMESEDGRLFPVLSKPVRVNSKSVEGGQILLGEINVPEGKYLRLRITAGDAKIRSGHGTADLAAPTGELNVPLRIRVTRGEATSVFLAWNPDSSIQGKYLFSPVLDARNGAVGLPSLMFFVSNEGSGNISVINRDSNKVVAVLKAGARPKGIAASLTPGQFKLYAADYGSNSVLFIDPEAQRIENEVLIRYGQGPYDLAVAETQDQRELLFVADHDSNSVSIVDVLTGRETGKVDVGNGPVAIAADPPLDQLESSPFISPTDLNAIRGYRQNDFNVYVADSRSQDISVIQVDANTGNAVGVTKIPVDLTPVSIAVDARRAKIYVVSHDSQYISVMNMADLIRGSLTASRLGNFGLSNAGVLPDPSLNRLYVLKEFPGELMVVSTLTAAGGAGFGALPVWGIIPLRDSPRFLLLDQEGREIYVVNSGSDSVSVINKTTGKEEKIIPVGRKPFEIAGFAQQ